MLSLLTSGQSAAMMTVFIFVFLAVTFVSLPLHEFAHAKTAALLGDDTPEKSGRLTLNPFAHIDIIGIVALLMIGIGWARPIPVNAQKCIKTKPKLAMLLISIAGPLANFFIAFIAVIVFRIVSIESFGIISSGKESFEVYIWYALRYFIEMNVYLTVFNLLPIPPFDGSRIFLAFLPTELYFKIMRYERVIFWVVFFLLIFGVFIIPLGFLNSKLELFLFEAAGFVDLFFN